jgi:hypothetical protein
MVHSGDPQWGSLKTEINCVKRNRSSRMCVDCRLKRNWFNFFNGAEKRFQPRAKG